MASVFQTSAALPYTPAPSYRQVLPLPSKNTGSSNLKNSESRRQSQTCLSYAEAHPVLRKAKTLLFSGMPLF